MISLDQMPKNNADLAKISVDFPRLDPNTASSCPVSMDDIQDYLRFEDADAGSVEWRELNFIRTALVVDSKYWIWDYRESDGAHCYVTVSCNSEGQICVGMDGNWHRLTPEQFILGDFHRAF